MIDKRKRRLYVKLVILFVCFIIVIRLFTLVLSKYESEANSTANVDIAFYLLKEDYKTMTLNLSSLFPQDEAYIYTFSIGNQDGEKTAETDLQYDLKIQTTTNLPLNYELYMNQKYIDSKATNIIKDNNVQKDEDGTYFRVMTTDPQTMNYQEPKTNIYQLVVYFPSTYNTTNYQDITESLEIIVNSKQIVE